MGRAFLNVKCYGSSVRQKLSVRAFDLRLGIGLASPARHNQGVQHLNLAQ